MKRTTRLASHLEHQGLSESEAQQEAARIVQNDDWFNIIPYPLSGSQMFSFGSSGGVLNMTLNIQHPIYEFLQVIETAAAESGNEVAATASVGILAMLLSWGRMEEDIEADHIRQEVQDRALYWGRNGEWRTRRSECCSSHSCWGCNHNHMTRSPWSVLPRSLYRCLRGGHRSTVY